MGLLPQKGATQRERQDRFLISAAGPLGPPYLYTMSIPRRQPTAEEIKNALLPDNDIIDPLEELIATGDAVFNLIRFSELDMGIKDAFYQLERQFTFYTNLVNGADGRVKDE